MVSIGNFKYIRQLTLEILGHTIHRKLIIHLKDSAGGMIKNLTWKDTYWKTTDDYYTVQRVLSILPRLTTVSLEKNYDFNIKMEISPVELPHLKILILNSDGIQFLNHFLGARNLVEVSLNGVYDHSENIVHFLEQQIMLKKLEVCGFLTPFIFSVDRNFHFRLTSLNITLYSEYQYVRYY